jgi:hypothetical protein
MFGFAVILVVGLVIGSPGHAQEPGADEMLAGLLMRQGFLCSRIVDKRPSEIPNQMEVTCVEYRDGTSRVRYILDFSTIKRLERMDGALSANVRTVEGLRRALEVRRSCLCP